MIVRGDFNLAGLQLLDRMIAAMVSELQFVGAAAESEADELMAETNSEDRCLAHEATNIVCRVGARFGITGAVRKKHAVRTERHYVFRTGCGWYDGHAAAFIHQHAQDVLLDAVVVGDDVFGGCGVFYADQFRGFKRTRTRGPLVALLRGDHLGKISSVHLADGACLGDKLLRIGFNGRDHGPHYAVIAQMPHQGARIDITDDGNLEFFQIFVRDLLRAPVGAYGRELARDQPFDIGMGGFIVFWIGAVIANLRVGQNNNLARIRRIGENFLVTGERSVKYDFSVTFAFGPMAPAAEDSTVFQREYCLHWISGRGF